MGVVFSADPSSSSPDKNKETPSLGIAQPSALSNTAPSSRKAAQAASPGLAIDPNQTSASGSFGDFLKKEGSRTAASDPTRPPVGISTTAEVAAQNRSTQVLDTRPADLREYAAQISRQSSELKIPSAFNVLEAAKTLETISRDPAAVLKDPEKRMEVLLFVRALDRHISEMPGNENTRTHAAALITRLSAFRRAVEGMDDYSYQRKTAIEGLNEQHTQGLLDIQAASDTIDSYRRTDQLVSQAIAKQAGEVSDSLRGQNTLVLGDEEAWKFSNKNKAVPFPLYELPDEAARLIHAGTLRESAAKMYEAISEGEPSPLPERQRERQYKMQDLAWRTLERLQTHPEKVLPELRQYVDRQTRLLELYEP